MEETEEDRIYQEYAESLNIPYRRFLDCIYFKKDIEGQELKYSFSDLTEDEMRQEIQKISREELEGICIILGKTIRKIGDEFDIYGFEEKENYE